MLARKKAEKRKAIASHSSALSSTAAAVGLAGTAAAVGLAGTAGKGASRKKAPSGDRGPHTRTLTRADAQAAGAEAERAELIKAIGDHVNTRLPAPHERGGRAEGDSDVDDDTNFHEKQAHLMEEARLAAGVQQRVISTHVEAYCKTATATGAAGGLPTVRVHHNANTITAVAALGLEVLVLGDKSGRVYMVDLAASQDAPSLFAQQSETPTAGGSGAHRGGDVDERHVDLSVYRRRRKLALEPALPRAVVSIAISDTRGNRPTTRDLFEKTTVDHSCPSYTVAGAEDGSIAVWETLTQRHRGLLFMHRKAVTGLSFRAGTADLYSASDDGTLRVWSVAQMMAVDKLFGHEGKVHDLHGLRRETCATVGDDGTMRFWKVDAATQQSYTYTVGQREERLAAAVAAGELVVTPAGTEMTAAAASVAIRLECVAMVNESVILAGATDGSLVLFDTGKRRPLAIVPAAHGFDSLQDGTGLEQSALQLSTATPAPALTATTATSGSDASRVSGRGRPPRVYDRRRLPNAISALATVPYADVAASASYDGVVRLWQVCGVGGGSAAGRRTALPRVADTPPPTPSLLLLAEVPVEALVTSLRFSPDGDALYVACAKECRRGRWIVCRRALNGVAVVPLTSGGARQLLGGAPGQASAASALRIEHVPAQLYHFADDNDDDDDDAALSETADDTAGDEERVGKKRVRSHRAAPGTDVALPYPDVDDEEGGESEGDSGVDEDVGRGADEGARAFFAVGKDGQLMFAPGGSAGSGAAHDVMKAHAHRSTSASGSQRTMGAVGGKVKKAKKAVPVRKERLSLSKGKAAKAGTGATVASGGSPVKRKVLKAKVKK